MYLCCMMGFEPTGWKEYELLDCGDFEKLERFGPVITIRPEPQAVWHRSLAESEWLKKAHVKFMQRSSHAGDWKIIKEIPSDWTLSYSLDKDKDITLRLALTSFKHTGVFPEQAVNWEFIYNQIKNMSVQRPRFLNLFAYTGGASLAACAAGADVYHVDSIRQVVNWASDNMKRSGLDGIHWVVEDALKFVQREVKRGNRYHGIILDPPSYGHGPRGEKWKLEDKIASLMQYVLDLLHDDESFLVLNLYSMGFSPLVAQNLIHARGVPIQAGELFITSRTGIQLPLGAVARFSTLALVNGRD